MDNQITTLSKLLYEFNLTNDPANLKIKADKLKEFILDYKFDDELLNSINSIIDKKVSSIENILTLENNFTILVLTINKALISKGNSPITGSFTVKPEKEEQFNLLHMRYIIENALVVLGSNIDSKIPKEQKQKEYKDYMEHIWDNNMNISNSKDKGKIELFKEMILSGGIAILEKSQKSH